MSDIEGKAARVAASEFQILADLDQKRRHMSERVFYPDTNDVSSMSEVVALSIARSNP